MKIKFANCIHLVFICLLVFLARSQENNDQDSQNEEDDNTLTQSQLAQLNIYPKVSTQLSGVSIDPIISYLQLSGTDTADLPLTSLSSLNQRSDFTVMFWFKVDTLPATGEFMQIFSIQKTLSCYIDSTLTVQCNSKGIQPLLATSDQIFIGKWNHLVVSFKASKQYAYLILQDDNQQIVMGNSSDAQIIQNQGVWSACLGMCMSQRQGFQGGIREFKVLSSYLTPSQSKIQKNMILNYNANVKGYYRFQPDTISFAADQFVSRVLYWRDGNNTMSGKMGFSVVPQNVCPQSFNYTQLYRFDLAQQMRPYKLLNTLKTKKYSYQMSLKFMSNSTSCFTTNITTAMNSCSLVHLEGVFMLYYQQPNVARFMFFSAKSYYQTHSSAFFIPNRQWISIRLFISQQGGYQIYILDQNQNIITSSSKQYDLQAQYPTQNLFLFQSLVGYVADFTLSDDTISNQNLDYVSKSPLIQFSYRVNSDQSAYSGVIPNGGRNKVQGQLMFFPKIDLVINSDRINQATNLFDGITCNDGHQVISLDQSSSFLNFSTPAFQFQNGTQKSSVEFWFKLKDKSTYNSTSQIFQLVDLYVDPFLSNYTYWVIFINNSQLNIAPFGLANVNDSAIISFSEFNEFNEDSYGWWHIACSFQFNVSVNCYLSNQNITLSRGYYMINIVRSFPTYSLRGQFGFYERSDYPTLGNFQIKELRIWRKQLSIDNVKQNQQQQIDPIFDNDLVLYLKLNSLRNLFFNAASINTLNSFQFQGDYAFLSQVQDRTLIDYTYYNYSAGLLQVRQEYQSHIVCPTYTYLKDENCYAEPVNEVVLAIFPFYDQNSQSLSWMFSLEYSSALDDSFLQLLQITWFSDDIVLQNLFQANQITQLISSTNFRQENTYEIQVSISNQATTFNMQQSISFVPNSCRWFVIDGYTDAFSAFQAIEELPGQTDINFKLNLIQNQQVICQQQSFYNQFVIEQISISYYVSGSERRIGIPPQANFTVSSSSQSAIYTDTEQDLQINVHIPAQQLVGLPTNTKIRILITIAWTSTSFQDILSQLGPVTFQNVLYTVNYQTADSTQLSVELLPKQLTLAINQTVNLDASKVTTRNIDMSFVVIAYSWQCPIYFTKYCSDQTNSNFTLPWSIFISSGASYGIFYQFQVSVALIRDGQVIYLTTAQSQIVWYNIAKPEFILSYSPSNILVSQPQDTYFTIIPQNFENSTFQNYTVQWQIFGQLAGRQSLQFQNLGQLMIVPSDSWKTNTTYNISLTLTYIKSPTISTNYSFTIPVYGQPFGGLVYISPRQGQLGEFFFLYLQGWQSYVDNSTIYYQVYTTLDSLGNIIGREITSRAMMQSETFKFLAQSSNPLVVKISDISGEVTISRVVGFIGTSDQQTNEQSELESSSSNSRLLATNQQDTSHRNFCVANDFYNTDNYQSETFISIHQKVIDTISTIQNDTCIESQNQKYTQLLQVYDKFYNQFENNDENKIQLLYILDQTAQTNAHKFDTELFQRVQAAKINQKYTGNFLQITNQELIKDLNLILETSIALFDLSKQITLDLNSLSPATQFQLITIKNNFSSQACVQAYDQTQLNTYSLSQLSGQITIGFHVVPELYRPNITVCAVIDIQTGQNRTDFCTSNLNITSLLLICTCNIMQEGEIIALFDDYSRIESAAVQFYSGNNKVFQANVSRIKYNSYLFITIICILCLYGLIGFVITLCFDKQDQINCQIQLSQEEKQLCIQVSALLNRSVQQVQDQFKQLNEYMNENTIVAIHIAQAINPKISPFIYYDRQQLRCIRFSCYQSQVNLLILGILQYFGCHYRQNQPRFDEVLDQIDISSACYAMAIGSVLLLPLSPQILIKYLSADTRKSQRIVFQILVLGLNFATLPISVITAYQAPASNQYLIAWAIFGSLLGSLVFTDTLRVLINSFNLPYPISKIQNSQSQTILNEIACMRRIKQQQLVQLQKKRQFENQLESIQTEMSLEPNENADLQAVQESLSSDDPQATNRKLNDAFRE